MRNPKTCLSSVSLFVLISLAFMLAMRFGPSVLAGTCTAPTSNNQWWAPGTTITVYIDPSLSSDVQAGAQAAVADWNAQSGLTGNNITMTTTSTDPGAGSANSVRIVNNPQGSPNNLANTSTQINTSSGQMFDATVSVNTGFILDQATGTPAYDPSGANAANFLNEVFDHELGHVFGENDLPIPNDSTGTPNACGQTPGASTMNGYCGTNDTGIPGGVSSKVTPCDNSVVNNDIATQGRRLFGPPAPTPTPTPTPSQPPPCSPINIKLDQDGGCNPSPIIVDIDGSGFQFTDAIHGVSFDIFASGVPVQVAWTDIGSTNAFLVLDRNGNGLIDSGAELFGNFTPQSDSPNANGFLALAEFDMPAYGGNGDGVIDSRDAVFSRLRLWQDTNHNGISEPWELHPLDEFGVQQISLDYHSARRVDEFGNQFRFRSQVDDDAHSHGARWAWDVFFVWQSR